MTHLMQVFPARLHIYRVDSQDGGQLAALHVCRENKKNGNQTFIIGLLSRPIHLAWHGVTPLLQTHPLASIFHSLYLPLPAAWYDPFLPSEPPVSQEHKHGYCKGFSDLDGRLFRDLTQNSSRAVLQLAWRALICTCYSDQHDGNAPSCSFMRTEQIRHRGATWRGGMT